MSHNPYAPPLAQVEDPSPERVPMYSPGQAGAGAFLGGPVGAIYFLWANFIALKQPEKAQRTLLLGGLLTLALVAIIPFLPESVPNLPFTILYMVIAVLVAQRRQMTLDAIKNSPEHRIHSNWRVLGLGLVCALGSAILVIGPMLLLAYLGVLDSPI